MKIQKSIVSLCSGEKVAESVQHSLKAGSKNDRYKAGKTTNAQKSITILPIPLIYLLRKRRYLIKSIDNKIEGRQRIKMNSPMI
jgi:hypothetical protein